MTPGEGHLLFALRNEGVNLEVLKAFFNKIAESAITDFIKAHPTGGRHRCIWFLYEFLTKNKLDIPDVTIGNYIVAIDGHAQLALPESAARRERRYRVLNNLIGGADFCPLGWADCGFRAGELTV